MRRKIIGRRAIGVAVMMALIVVGAVVTLENPSQAAPTERQISYGPPVSVDMGDVVTYRLMVFNKGRRRVSVRHRLLDAVTGEAIMGTMSDSVLLRPRTGAVFDVEIPSADVEIPSEFPVLISVVVCSGCVGNSLAGSIQVFDPFSGDTKLYARFEDAAGSEELQRRPLARAIPTP